MCNGATARQILSELGRQGVEARRLCQNSRLVKNGDIFLAIPGHRVDGRIFIDDAIQNGAAAVLAEAGIDLLPQRVPVIIVPGLSRLAGWLAAEVYGYPSRDIAVIGITGTNGKTSIAQWLAQALGHHDQRALTIGTLGYGFVDALTATSNTTPDALTLQETLANFRSAQYCSMEVSSIGLNEGRCNGVLFKAAVFTNLNHDHLDYHGSMQAYGDAKEKLFTWPDLEAAVINLDDPFGQHLARIARARKKIGYSIDGVPQDIADTVDCLLTAHRPVEQAKGITFSYTIGERASEREYSVSTPILGRYNVGNFLAVAGVLHFFGIRPEDISHRLARLQPVAGRMQRVNDGDKEPLLVVDYAHKPAALAGVLGTLRAIAAERKGRLLCLFGCGGNRDQGKRRLMGEIAQRLADDVYLTDDNPRDEDPADILREIAVGAPRAHIVPGRAGAIDAAAMDCGAGDVLLIAGKGHENYQEIAGVKYPLSDVECAQHALQLWRDQHKVES